MRRLHDSLERVAAGTIEQKAFLLVRARHACQPFGIGEMGGQVLHFFELDLSLGFLAWGDIPGAGPLQLIAGRARFQSVVSGFESRGRESKAARRAWYTADGGWWARLL